MQLDIFYSAWQAVYLQLSVVHVFIVSCFYTHSFFLLSEN